MRRQVDQLYKLGNNVGMDMMPHPYPRTPSAEKRQQESQNRYWDRPGALYPGLTRAEDYEGWTVYFSAEGITDGFGKLEPPGQVSIEEISSK